MTTPPDSEAGRASRGEAESAALVSAAKRGDREALDELLRRHLPLVRAFVRLRSDRAFRARESQSDVVQSVCREVLEGLGDFEYRGEAAFRGWLHVVSLNKLRERARYHRADRRDPDQEEAPFADDRVVDYEAFGSPSAIVGQSEQASRIEAAFDELKPEHREVIALARLSGLPAREIGRRMNRSETAVRQLLSRALVRLSALLEGGRDGAPA